MILKFLTILMILLSTSSAYANESYRTKIDEEINKLNLMDLRMRISNEIHKMEEPWGVTFYRDCLSKKVQALQLNKVYNEQCDKFLDEPLQDRYERLELIADAIVLELKTAKDKYGRGFFWSQDDLALMVLVKMHNESAKFALKVHTGKLKGDNGKSACLAMIWSRSTDQFKQKELIGYSKEDLEYSLQQTRNCVSMAYSHLIYHGYRCVYGDITPSKYNRDYSRVKINQYSVAKIYRGYGSGKSCNPEFRIDNSNGKSIKIILTEPLKRARQFWKLKNK